MKQIRLISYFFASIAVYTFASFLLQTLSFLVQGVQSVADLYRVDVQVLVNAWIITSTFQAVGVVCAYLSFRYLRQRIALPSLRRAVTACGAIYIGYAVYLIDVSNTHFSAFRTSIIISACIFLIIGILVLIFGWWAVLMRSRMYKAYLQGAKTSRILLDKKCKDCDTDVPALTKGEIAKYLKLLATHWDIVRDKKMRQMYQFKSFAEAMVFVEQLALLAESEGHHPDITISYNKVTVELTTHAIGGLSESDFIMAHKIELMLT